LARFPFQLHRSGPGEALAKSIHAEINSTVFGEIFSAREKLFLANYS
jgi:hypothetical protein